tara:strand:- start:3773 stop:4054 length:282 start_codon:yes stop_codon:yes gene_type:complete
MEASTEVGLQKLDGKLQRMLDTIETVKERQEGMADDITKIKEAVYNPDEGLYARVRELESWKSTQTKLMWILVTASVGVIAALLTGVNISVGP